MRRSFQIDRHSYVDVDGRVILTFPATEAGAKPERTAPGLSKDFSKAGISQLAEMREWKGAIASVIRSGVAEGNWLVPLLREHRVTPASYRPPSTETTRSHAETSTALYAMSVVGDVRANGTSGSRMIMMGTVGFCTSGPLSFWSSAPILLWSWN
jgi:hypothetical protein